MEPGQVVAGRFEIQALIGEGGMGRVFRALDRLDGGVVAVKILRAELAREPRIRRRFLREARAIRRLVHPNIVRLLDGREDAGTLYMAMEYLEGDTLGDHRANGFDPPVLLHVVDQVLAALAFAHARGVIHRDVKPENVALTPGAAGDLPRVKLLDFGFARVENDSDPKLTQVHGDAFGTPQYMAPEQASGKGGVGAETDLYAVGVILFELISGRPPYVGAHGMAVALKHLLDEIPALTPRAGFELPDGLDDIVYKALAKQPMDRFRSAAEMRRALASHRPQPGGSLPAVSVLRGSGPDGSMEDETLAQPLVFAAATPAPLEPPLSLDDGDSEDIGEMPTLAGGMIVPVASGLGPPVATDKLGLSGGAHDDEAFRVGRRPELVWLWARVHEVCGEEGGRVVLLGGAPGMGRRRLVNWLRDEVAEGGWMLPLGGARRDAGAAEHTGLRALLRDLFGPLPDDHGEAEVQVRAIIERWGGAGGDRSASRNVSAVVSYLRPPSLEAGDLAALPEVSGSVLHARVLKLMRGAARELPLLLLLDTPSRDGGELLPFLLHLVDEVRREPFPVMVVLPFDSDDAGRPVGEHAEAVMALAGQGAPEVRVRLVRRLETPAVVEMLCRFAPLDAEAAEAIASRTDGNPFFARELVLLFRQTDQLVDVGGRLRLAGGPGPGEWPRTLAETLLRRSLRTVAELADGDFARQVLELAVILGEQFDYALLVDFLARVQGEHDAAERSIESLIQAGLLEESRTDEADRLRIVHAVLRDALLEARSKRADVGELHRHAAEAKLGHYGTRRGPVAREIAEHYRLAGEPLLAGRFYIEAAAWLRSEGKPERACDVLELGDRLLSGLSGPEALRGRAALWLDLAELEMQRKDLNRARTLAIRVHQWARQEGEAFIEGRSLLVASDILRRQGHFEEAQRGYASARAAFERTEDVQGAARCDLGRAVVERSLRQLDAAVELFDRARRSLEGIGDRLGTARAWRGLGEIALRRSKFGVAREQLSAAREGYADAGDRAGVTFCHWLLGETHRLLQDPEAAQRDFVAAVRGCAALGDRAGLARAHLSLARLHRARSRFGTADGHLRGALEAYEGIGDLARTAAVQLELGVVALEQGHPVEAERWLEAASGHARAHHDHARLATLNAALAWAAAGRADDPRCDQALAAALKHAEVARPDEDFARALEALADLDLRAGRRARAARLLERALGAARAVGASAVARRIEGKLSAAAPG